MYESLCNAGRVVRQRLCPVLYVAAAGQAYDGTAVDGRLPQVLGKGVLGQLFRHHGRIPHFSCPYLAVGLEVGVRVFGSLRHLYAPCLEQILPRAA